ncbi:hypothetical protein BDAP_002509 [Binucleata daphniae]
MRFYCTFLLALGFITSLFLLSLGCSSSKIVPLNVGNFVSNKKYLDKTYVKQASKLEKCILELDDIIILQIETFKRIWTNEAAINVLHTLTRNERQEFRLLNYKQCFDIIAEHNAKRFVCVGFEIMEGEEDVLIKYALEEYQACITHKKGLNSNPLRFEMPQIGVRVDQHK